MTDWELDESRAEKLERLADDLGRPPGDVIESMIDVEYLEASVDSFTEEATAKQALLEHQLGSVERSLASLRSEGIEVDIDGIVLEVGDELNETLEEHGVPRLRTDGPFAEFQLEANEVAYEMATHPFLEIRTAGDGLRYVMSEVNDQEIEELAETLRDSRRGLVEITDTGKPVVGDAGDPDVVPHVDEDYVLVEVNDVDRSAFCQAAVSYGAADEVLEWATQLALNVSKELQYRYGSAGAIDRDGKLRYGYRDDADAFTSGDETGDKRDTLLRVQQYPETDEAVPTIAMEVYDDETGNLMTVLHAESSQVVAAVGAELLQGALWLRDETTP